MESKTIELFREQFEAFNFKSQVGTAIAGVRSGKTFLGSVWAGKKIQEFPVGTGIIGAPTNKILQQSTLPKFFQNFPQLRRYFKESKGVIELPTGGTVYCRSFDQPLGVEGITANWIWLVEAGQMPLLAWTISKSGVAMTGGQIFISTTPYTRFLLSELLSDIPLEIEVTWCNRSYFTSTPVTEKPVLLRFAQVRWDIVAMRLHARKSNHIRRRLLQTTLVVLSMFLSVSPLLRTVRRPERNGQ
jgi:hypothetical protein